MESRRRLIFDKNFGSEVTSVWVDFGVGRGLFLLNLTHPGPTPTPTHPWDTVGDGKTTWGYGSFSTLLRLFLRVHTSNTCQVFFSLSVTFSLTFSHSHPPTHTHTPVYFLSHQAIFPLFSLSSTICLHSIVGAFPLTFIHFLMRSLALFLSFYHFLSLFLSLSLSFISSFYL